jgi:hypothetical protein
MSENVRQRYSIATGGGPTAPPKGPTPGFKKGGHVFRKGAQNRAGSHGHAFQVAGKKGGC